ncbi:MAG: hypothetical protein JWQ97_3345 [Phenylobacterium sp.]|nr:hypothetical protein [Phenylobacterium sp.]
MSAMKKPKRTPTGDYEVGYGKTPLHSRFKPGQGGWPKGKKRRRSAPLSELEAVFGRKSTITVDGKKISVTAGQAMLFLLQQKAMGGDLKSIEAYLKYEDRYLAARRELLGEDADPAIIEQKRQLSAKLVSLLEREAGSMKKERIRYVEGKPQAADRRENDDGGEPLVAAQGRS